MASSSSPPKKKGRFNLCDKLFEQYEAGQNVDTTVIVSDRKLCVHKNVLIGVSHEFSDTLTQQQDGGAGKGMITFPEGTSFHVAKGFIKVMYLQKMDLGLGVDFNEVLDVLSLCDRFLVPDLLDDCVSSVCDEINADNCVEVCEASFKLLRSQDILLKAGLDCLARNIDTILIRHGQAMSSKLWDKILHIEGPDVNQELFNERRLFLWLLRWRRADESREADFRNLLSLIRFPLMKLQEIARIVEPSGVLSDTDLADIYTYIIGGGVKGKRIPRFITHSRKVKLAQTSGELKRILQHAQPSDFIQLDPRPYHIRGGFNIPKKVTLCGAADGTTTIITNMPKNKPGPPAVSLESNDVHISNLRIWKKYPVNPEVNAWGLALLGSRNVIQNIAFKKCGLFLDGPKARHNKITKVSFYGCGVGVMISGGRDNRLSALTLNSVDMGVIVKDKATANMIRDIRCTNVKTGVGLKSNKNIVSNLTYLFSNLAANNDNDQIAVKIVRGGYNIVTNTRCHPTSNFKNTFAIKIIGIRKAKNNIINVCVGGAVNLGGVCNSLNNVDAGENMTISGTGHRLANCRVERCVHNNSSGVKTIGCNFGNRHRLFN